MRTEITLEQFRYAQASFQEFIKMYPDDIGYWLNAYRVMTREVTTIVNMAADRNIFNLSEAELFRGWFKELIEAWPRNAQKPEKELFWQPKDSEIVRQEVSFTLNDKEVTVYRLADDTYYVEDLSGNLILSINTPEEFISLMEMIKDSL